MSVCVVVCICSFFFPSFFVSFRLFLSSLLSFFPVFFLAFFLSLFIGCNVILFTTGNGSVTNFPFVPTLKALTTTARFKLLEQDMDINAGLFLDGELTLDELGERSFDLLLRVASGHPSKGEIAGHHQIQLWRNWCVVEGDEADAEESELVVAANAQLQQESATETMADQAADHSSEDNAKQGRPLKITNFPDAKELSDIFLNISLLDTSGANTMVRPDVQQAADRVGLILPTSLCSGQVAVRIAERLNEKINFEENIDGKPNRIGKLTRFVALPHTEGCGHSSGDHEALVLRTLLGYARHPMVGQAVLLEHGCEKTHNGRMQQELEALGMDTNRYGFASVQLDGGFESVSQKVRFGFVIPVQMNRTLWSRCACAFL
eukprot:m.90632 g.90632  ORF g.90632 m.90632 type:complete len:377 (-) comp14602_c0_seq28:2726-3856(-)